MAAHLSFQNDEDEETSSNKYDNIEINLTYKDDDIETSKILLISKMDIFMSIDWRTGHLSEDKFIRIIVVYLIMFSTILFFLNAFVTVLCFTNFYIFVYIDEVVVFNIFILHF